MPGLLAGKRAVVTGGVRRIGRGLAQALAAEGADVVITTRSVQCEAEDAVTELQRLGVRARAVALDLKDPASVKAGIAAAAEYLGGIDLLVNNAGAFETAALESITPEQWDAMFATNTRGPFLVGQAAYSFLREARGRIVNIGSLGGMHPWATHAHYCTSKAALHMLSQTMAKAWAPEVCVNCVAPGMIVTSEQADAAYASFVAKTPMRRNGRVEDVAAAVLFFSTCPAFITGQLLAVDGGLGLS